MSLFRKQQCLFELVCFVLDKKSVILGLLARTDRAEMVKCLASKAKTIAFDLKLSTLPLSQIKLCKAGMISQFGSYHIGD